MSVLIATWNSAEHLAVALEAMRLHCRGVNRIVVIDNASSDFTRRVAASDDRVRLIRLPVNAGHGPALDLAAITARTEFIIALDPDAFPIDSEWVDHLIGPLREGAQVSGVHMQRSYVHPCALAIRTQRFVERRHTFTQSGSPAEFGSTGWDTGERISMLEQPHVHLLPVSSTDGPGSVGTSWEGAIYHNFYSVRHLQRFGPAGGGVLDDVVEVGDATTAWDRNCRKYLGLDAERRAELVEAAGR